MPLGLALWHMTYVELSRFELGAARPESTVAHRLPQQQSIAGAKIPTLSEVFDLVRQKGVKQAKFNFKTKIQPEGFSATTGPRIMAEALAALTVEQRWLDSVQRNQPGISPCTAGLDIDAYGGSAPRLAQALGAENWSLYYKHLNAVTVRQAQSLGLKVAAWRVNNVPDMRHMLSLGLDSIITDGLDRLIALLRQQGARP